MTIVNVTVTADAAWLSTDTMLTNAGAGDAPRGGITTDPERARLRGDGRPPKIVITGHIVKLGGRLDFKAGVLSSGWLGHTMIWRDAFGHMPCRHFDELADQAPAKLREIVRAVPFPSADMTTVIVGWSPSRGRMIGYALTATEGFEPRPLEGHGMGPLPDPDDEDYPRLWELSEQARQGRHVDAFHLALARNQVRMFRRGLFPAGAGVGGHLQLLHVTRDTIELRTLGSLDEGLPPLEGARCLVC